MNKELIKRKQSVINTAIEIIDELGLQGLTTREIAKREGVTEPALYKQFKSKQQIILAILDEYSKFEKKIMNTVIEQEMRSVDGIFYFAKAYGDYYQGYPQITKVMFSMDMYCYDEDASNKMRDILLKRQTFMETVVAKGQKEGELERGLSPDKMAEVILGTIRSLTFNWKMENTKENLGSKINGALEWLLR